MNPETTPNADWIADNRLFIRPMDELGWLGRTVYDKRKDGWTNAERIRFLQLYYFMATGTAGPDDVEAWRIHTTDEAKQRWDLLLDCATPRRHVVG